MADKPTPTPEQQRVIDLTDRSVLLSAAAGSGKTATLTRRLIQMITRAENPLDVSRMLVVTFTRAAAEELRSRISEALLAAVAESPGNAYLTRQALLLPAARIRTIDAFCNDLVKGHTDTLGISPLYRIADEAEMDLLGVTLLDEVIDDAYNGVFIKEGLDTHTVTLIAESVKESGTLATLLYQLYKTKLHGTREGVSLLASNADVLHKEAALPFFATRAGGALARHYREDALHKKALLSQALDALFAKCGESPPIWRPLVSRFTYVRDFCDRIADAADTSLSALLALKEEYAPPAATCRGSFSPEELFFKDLVYDLTKEIKDFLGSLSWDEAALSPLFLAEEQVSRSLYLLLAEFEERLKAEKRRRALCDYDDITGFAHTLLVGKEGEPTPLALEIRASLDAVCIDEYQDVNEYQHQIFRAISPENGRFMVGDIKQSIYAFRGAVPDIFNRLRNPDPARDGALSVLYLTRNFRSEPPILDFANGVFDFLFPITRDAIDYLPEDRLYTEKPASGTPPPTFYLLKRESGDREGGEAALTEGDLIARKILSLLQNGRKKDGSAIRPSDIAILCRSYPHALVGTLRQYGIPLKTKDKSDFFSRAEILLALSLCHAIGNPHRDIPLGGLLRSPLYGFTLEELMAVREASATGTLFDALSAYAAAHPENERCARVTSDIARFRAMSENTSAYRLLRTVFTEVGIYATVNESGRAALHTFLSLARDSEGGTAPGLHAFLLRLTDMQETGQGLPEREVGEDEAVTLSTIHGSKGLEYPVCILAGTGASLKKADKTPFHYSAELGLVTALPAMDGQVLLKTPLSLAHDTVKKKKEIEEAIRVLYVALTRPKEQLFVFCSTAQKNTATLLKEAEYLRLSPTPTALHAYATYATWMLAALREHPTLYRYRELLPPYLIEEDVLTEDEDADADGTDVPITASAEEIAAIERTLSERFAFRYPHEAQTRMPAKLSVSALYPGVLDELTARSPMDAPLSYPADTAPTAAVGADEASAARDGEKEEDDFTPSVPAFLSDKEENAAALAGTATHLFLQFCDFSNILTTVSCQNEVIEQELTRLVDKGFLRAADARRVRVGELVAFLRSSLTGEICAAKKTYREFRFHALLPARDFALLAAEALAEEVVFAQGVIDLLLEREDGSLLLVDYKTDRLPAEARTDTDAAARLLFDRHGEQLSVYAAAVEKMLGRAPAVAIYSLPAGKLLFKP